MTTHTTVVIHRLQNVSFLVLGQFIEKFSGLLLMSILTELGTLLKTCIMFPHPYHSLFHQKKVNTLKMLSWATKMGFPWHWDQNRQGQKTKKPKNMYFMPQMIKISSKANESFNGCQAAHFSCYWTSHLDLNFVGIVNA